MIPTVILRALPRLARLPGLLRLLCAALLASGLLALPGTVAAATISNTASVSFTGPTGSVTRNSNTTSLATVPGPTPGVVTFYQYAPGHGSTSIPFDGGRFDSGGGSFAALATPVALDGSPVPLAAPVEVRPTSVFHLDEPVFVTLADGNRDVDPATREFIDVTVTTSAGDHEVLRLQETGPDTGVFAAVIASVAPGAGGSPSDGRLTVGTDTRLTVSYQDPVYLDDTSSTAALVDPFGFVFDSASGAPLDGATVTLIDMATGLPATVKGDDGVSSFPSTVTTGSSVTDSGGQIYNLPAGGFRFPYVQPGSYRFQVTPPPGYSVPSGVPDASLPDNPATAQPYAVVQGSHGEVFTVLPGPALNIDIPADPAAGQLLLQKTVSRAQASAGDFLQYRLSLQNTAAVTATAPAFSDRLPPGMRYRQGSLRIDGKPAADPAVSSDGRTLTFSSADLAAGATVQVSYVVELGAGVQPGDAVNSARASASGGALNSNVARVAVRIVEPLFSGRATLIGRVFEGDCNTPWRELRGVANARLLMEDGTYVVTDKDGQYHFEGVRPGTHVVQLDVDSLPGGLEPVSCLANTRFAGRSFSQFVDVKGGALWRADFHVRARRGEVGIRLHSRLELQQAQPAPQPPAELAQLPVRQVRDYTLSAEFDSCEASLQPDGQAAVDKLVQSLSGLDIKRIELTGNTDDQHLSARCRARFADNYRLSEARARTVGEALAAGLFLRADQVVTAGRGPDAPVASNKTADGRARNRRTDVKVFLNEAGEGDAPALLREAGKAAAAGLQVAGMSHRIEVDSSSARAGNFSVMAMLPDDAGYRRGSTRVDGQPADDPAQAGQLLTFRLGAAPAAGARRVIEFQTYALESAREAAAAAGPQRRHYTLRLRFDSCSADLRSDGRGPLDALLAELRRQGHVSTLELVGHSDDQRLSARCRERFADHEALSLAQAQAVGQALATGLGLAPTAVQASGRGAAAPVADNASAAGRARNRRIEIEVGFDDDLAAITRAQPGAVACPDKAYAFKALARFDDGNNGHGQTPAAETRLACPAPAAEAGPSATSASAGSGTPASEARDGATPAAEEGSAAALPAVVEADSSRRTVSVTEQARIQALPPELQAREEARRAIKSDADAGGADQDWASGQAPGNAWLFPAPDYNPRAPATRVVIKHAPDQTVVLKLPDGSPASGLNFDGSQHSADGRVDVDVWRGLPLKDGDNTFTAEIHAAGGRLLQTLTRTVHYANQPVRAELVPEQSILLADGMHRPVLAVRFLDRDGRPVRAGVSGPLRLNAPYRSWEEVEQEQKRQLAGSDRFDPVYRVEGDDGIAYIELAPTTESGTVQLDLSFQLADNSRRRQELRAWLEPQARDWVVVGFAEGTLGYNTLKQNSQALAAGEKDGGYSDGQVSLYAKGRVLGKWLLTMAYDSDKPGRRDSLLGVIDPQQYYTLYGDGTQQRYDAPSQSKLYLKLERGQFYALFGDYTTGLTQTRLSRYSRSLNGFKAENAGGPVVFTAFAADTPQSHARDEIQGNGTSGLYRLAQRNIVLNSEQVRIETRDRLHSEKLVQSRTLTRHLDYDIDYANGTLFFHEPIPSRDADFNPTFIVVDYETLGTASRELNAGGRVGVDLNGGRVQVGVTGIHDESNLSSTNLAGVDAKVKLGRDAELRVEAAQTRGQVATLSPEGMAWLTEYEYHSGRLDSLLYARRQEPSFGLNQQSLSETGQQKLGAEGQWHLDRNWSLQGQAYEQDNLGTDVTRDALTGKLQYKHEEGGFSVGAQAIQDRAGSGLLAGQSVRSEQATAAANRFFFNRKLELSAQAETAFGGQNGSVDYPDRYVLGGSYALSDSARLLLAQELTDGSDLRTSTTRAGLQAVPWKGARLDSTLNQSQISEYGPRTFGLFGLTQAFVLSERWGLDLSVDSSQTLSESGKPVPVVNPAYPVAPGGSLSGPGLTEDFVAVSSGATYRSELWSWNGRLENRNGETTDRQGLVSNFLRQAEAGVAFASAAQYFRTEQDSGSRGRLGSIDLSWAWRPLGVQWSLLDRLELRYEDVANGSGVTGSGLFGNNSLTVQNGRSRRLINNFALNRVSREWTGADRTGNLFRRYERNQWSLYYGAKYAVDSYDGVDYSGYTDILGLEVRHDLKPWLDIGLQASSLNAWTLHQHAYAFGPMIGASPVENGWITLGWNLRGFTDRDFDAARYTAQGPYLQLRFKFDQNTRFGHRAESASDTTNTRAGE